MSLEKALAENTAALIANTEALDRAAAGREKALEAATSLKSGTVGKASKPDEDDGDEPTKSPPKKTETKVLADKKPAAKKKAVTLDGLKAAVGAFLAGPKEWDKLDEEEAETLRNDRTDFVVSMLAEVGAAKVSEIDKDDWERCLDYIARKDAGEDVDFSEDEPKSKSASLID